MAIPIGAIASAAKEVAETAKPALKETLQKDISEATEVTKGLWPDVEGKAPDQKMTPDEIGKEAWDINKEKNDGKEESSGEIVINIITRNQSLEGDRHPITGVEFSKKVIELPNGEKIEGVFPNFESKFDAKIPEELYEEKDKTQFCECNKQLLDAIESNPELKSQFTEEQIEQIKDGISDGTAPDGFVWHHDAEPGVIKLTDSEIHANTGHTGGRFVWGGGSENR